MSPQPLDPTQRAALAKLGDVILPGDGDIPSLSAAGWDHHADESLAT
jgi:hypothetical protein